MLVVGAKGFAKQILDDLIELVNASPFNRSLAFFDDVSEKVDDLFQNLFLAFYKFRVIRSFEVAKTYLSENRKEFVLGVANPQVRKIMFDKFSAISGICTSTISSKANISEHDVIIESGVNILPNVIIEPSAKIGLGSLINVGSHVHHDVKIGEFVEISPRVCLCGNVEVGNLTFIGASATILPKVKIGKNVVIGAGAVVTKDVPDNVTFVGVPAKGKTK